MTNSTNSTNLNTLDDIKAPLRAKVAELQAALVTHPYTLQEAKDALPRRDELFKTIAAQGKGYTSALREWTELAEAVAPLEYQASIDRYQETLNADLVKITHRYLITNGSLVSPAGFHREDGVILANSKMHQTNKRPRSLPSDLKCYDMKANGFYSK